MVIQTVDLHCDVKTSLNYLLTYLLTLVACWLLVPKFASSNPAEAVGFFRTKKILNTPSSGREVKPFVPCRILRHVKERESVCMEVAAIGRNYRPFLAQVVLLLTIRVSGGDTWRCK